MWFSKFPFLRYILFFFLGIWISPWFQSIPFRYCFALLLGLWCIYTLLVIYVSFQPSFPFKSFIACLAYANLVLTGAVFSMERSFVNHPNHLIHLQSPLKGYLGIVRQFDEQKPKTKANLVSVFQGVQDSTIVDLNGEVIIYHRSSTPLLPGQVSILKERLNW
jgi:competence protein ComEC